MFINRILNALQWQSGDDVNRFEKENCDIFEVRYSAKKVGYNYSLIQQLFSSMPNQDVCSIRISYGSDTECNIDSDNFTDDQTTSIEELNSYVSDEDDLNVEITISKKCLENTLSVYDFTEFSKWLFNKNLMEFISCCNAIGNNQNKPLLLRCIDSDVYLRSGFLNFDSVENQVLDQSTRPSLHDMQEVSGIVCDPPLYFTPDDFHITGTMRNFPSQYVDYINRIEQILSIAYISNQAYLQDNDMRINLKGYRVIDERINFLRIRYNSNLYRIYNWTFSPTNIIEKIALTRNLISIGCKWKSILEVDEAVLPAIQSNYNLYLQGNVKDYLALKKEVAVTIQNYCNKVSDAISSFTGSLKSNYIAMFGYMATVLFTKGIQKSTTEIFTSEITALTALILFGSLLICILSIFELNQKYKYFNKMIDGLRAQYNDVLEEDVLIKIIDKNGLLLTARDNYSNNLWVVSCLWIISILGLFLLLDGVSGNAKLLFFINIFSG